MSCFVLVILVSVSVVPIYVSVWVSTSVSISVSLWFRFLVRLWVSALTSMSGIARVALRDNLGCSVSVRSYGCASDFTLMCQILRCRVGHASSDDGKRISIIHRHEQQIIQRFACA